MALALSELIPPFHREIFHGFPGHDSDVEIWRLVIKLLQLRKEGG